MYKVSPNITRKIDIDETAIITPALVGQQLNLASGLVTKNTVLIQQYIDTAIEQVEKYSWLSLRRTTYVSEFTLPSDMFYSFINGDLKLSLERSPILALADITKIEYLNSSGVYVEFDRGALTSEGLYLNVTEKIEQRDWASIYFITSVPYDTRINAYKIKVTFVAGFTISDDPVTDIPHSLKTALLQIVAYYYTNRGDCSEAGCDLGGYPVPCSAKAMIDLYAISRTVIGGEYTPASDCGCGFGFGC